LISNQKVFQEVKIIIILITLVLICLILNLLSITLKETRLNQPEKFSPFECGFDPSHQQRASFSLRFFILTIIFLIFDIEITILLPLPLRVEDVTYILTITWNIIIYILLLIGLIFEWKQGALNWIYKMWLKKYLIVTQVNEKFHFTGPHFRAANPDIRYNNEGFV